MTDLIRPRRLMVLDALTETLQQITPANGYQHNLADKVFRGRMFYGDSDPIPLVSILEPPLAPDQLPTPISGVANFGPYDLLIQGFVEDDKTNPTDPAYFLLADVKRRLAFEKKRQEADNIFGMGKYVQKLEIGLGVVRPADEVSSHAYFWLNIILDYLDDMEDPFE